MPTGVGAPRPGTLAALTRTAAACQVLRGPSRCPHNSDMDPQTRAPAATELPLRPQDEVECRRCEIHCDKIVYPSACIARACPFAYAYEEFGHRYVGCMQKVYEVEIDIEMLAAAEARPGGFGGV